MTNPSSTSKSPHFKQLIWLNIGLSLFSLSYDLHVIRTIPLWAWPFVVICPLWPLVLALAWYTNNKYLKGFAALATASYGLLAIVFYPLLMHATFFNWPDTGNIIWVWLYAIQGWYLLRTHKVPLPAILIAFTFLITSFTIQYKTLGFGYLDYAALSPQMRIFLLGVAYATSVITCLISVVRWQQR